MAKMNFTRLNMKAIITALLLSILCVAAVAAEPTALKSGVEMGLFTASDVYDYMQYLTLCRVVLCSMPLFLVFLALMTRPEKESVFGVLFYSAVLVVGLPAVLWLLHFLAVGEAFDAVHSSYITDQIRQFSSQHPEISQALGDGRFTGKNLLLFDFFRAVRTAMSLAFVVGMVAWLIFLFKGWFDFDSGNAPLIKWVAMIVILGVFYGVVRFFVIDDYAAIESVFEAIEVKQYLE